MSNNNKLKFFDLAINNDIERFTDYICRKETFSNAVTPANSFRPQKLVAFHSMMHRFVSTTTNAENISKELELIKAAVRKSNWNIF